jgi:DNA mismatch endonuclease (patch repair protein)
MADVFSKQKRSQVMAAIKSVRNKGTELKLVSIFRTNAISGWRRNQKIIGKPDFIFRRERLAVFVDGCFWHGCKKHSRLPKSNLAYWQKKLGRNIERDRRNIRLLRKSGWQVMRIWEHSLQQKIRVAQRIKAALTVKSRQS